MLLAGPVAGRLSIALRLAGAARDRRVSPAVAFVAARRRARRRWEIYVASALMGIGIGFAFASMANLIVESVPPTQTGVATGMNTIVRSIGGAIGAQVSASIIT